MNPPADRPIRCLYDAPVDVLYVSFEPNPPALGKDIAPGIVLRYIPEDLADRRPWDLSPELQAILAQYAPGDVVGVTLIDFYHYLIPKYGWTGLAADVPEPFCSHIQQHRCGWGFWKPEPEEA